MPFPVFRCAGEVFFVFVECTLRCARLGDTSICITSERVKKYIGWAACAFFAHTAALCVLLQYILLMMLHTGVLPYTLCSHRIWYHSIYCCTHTVYTVAVWYLLYSICTHILRRVLLYLGVEPIRHLTHAHSHYYYFLSWIKLITSFKIFNYIEKKRALCL
jgi:hypothetical protein